MLLCELFDKVYPFKQTYNLDELALYEFDSAIGPFMVAIVQEEFHKFVSERNIRNVAKLVGDGSKEISISDEYGSVYEVTFRPKSGNFKKTNRNEDMYGIIGTTIAIMVDFAKSEKVAEYNFSADIEEPGRVKLYDRMCKDLTHHNFKLVKRSQQGGHVYYVLDNLNNGVK